MGYKGFLRSVSAEVKRQEREAKRRQRELDKQRQQMAKMEHLELARFEVEQYENSIDVITSVHKDCGEEWNWEAIRRQTEPRKPHQDWFTKHEERAQKEKEEYSPGRRDRLLQPVDSQMEELSKAVILAREQDQGEYTDAVSNYQQEHREWVELQKLSESILNGDPEAFTFAIELLNPFTEISDLGSKISFHTDSGKLMEVSLKVNSESIIPPETKILLKSGKLSTKKMTKTKFYELYQDHVCGCALRVAREIFALLPSEMVIFTATTDLLNTSTGHMEEQPIISVAMPRKTIEYVHLTPWPILYII